PEATREELLEALMERIKGPDFPTGGLIVGRRGIEDAYRTGRGSVMMRAGIADIRDDSSSRTGQRLVIVLKRDAVAKVVVANLYKHTQLQDTFGCNMVALVDNVPRTLSLEGFIRHWVTHQIEVVVRRSRYLLREAEQRAHILRGLVKALDQLDAVIALIRGSASADAARSGLMELLDVDEVQANAILDMQLRKLAALER